MNQNDMSNSYRGPSIDTSYRIWPSCFRVEDFQKSTNQKQELLVVDIFVNGLGQNEQSSQRTASYQVSVHLAKWFQRKRFFRNQPIRNKNCLWWPCLLTDQEEMSNLNGGPSIDVTYQVSVHLAKRFTRRILKISQSETRMACGGHVC